jgi:hypothetical protein
MKKLFFIIVMAGFSISASAGDQQGRGFGVAQGDKRGTFAPKKKLTKTSFGVGGSGVGVHTNPSFAPVSGAPQAPVPANPQGAAGTPQAPVTVFGNNGFGLGNGHTGFGTFSGGSGSGTSSGSGGATQP